MIDFDDFPLNKTTGDPPKRSRLRVLPLVGIALIIGTIAVTLLYWTNFRQTEEEEEEAPPTATERPNVPVQTPEPDELEEAKPDEFVLPLLNNSDGIIRDLAAALSAHPNIAAWLITNELVRTFAVVVENIADGQNPAGHLSPLEPREVFLTAGSGEELHLDPRSYDRYNGHGDIVASVDAAGAASLYETFKPLIDESYRELGHPEDGFDDTLERAIVRLLETPVVETEVLLIARLVYYEFSDPTLEALSPVQKQFLNMGPRNVRLIQTKLRELSATIGISADRLPTPVVIAR